MHIGTWLMRVLGRRLRVTVYMKSGNKVVVYCTECDFKYTGNDYTHYSFKKADRKVDIALNQIEAVTIES